MEPYWVIVAILLGYIADRIWADPEHFPHPIIAFGKAISFGEKILNRGDYREIKGVLLALLLVMSTFLFFGWIQSLFLSIAVWAEYIFVTIIIFIGLAGTTLISECKAVFEQLKISLEAGRKQVARIVGRETATLNAQNVRSAALETMSENLSDGVVAPLFWFAVAGVPGMMAYKMVNTLDSMIGYKSERYKKFGAFAARLDDVANYMPARITAMLMVLVSGKRRALRFCIVYGRNHSSPNAGYPEAALAGILDARFGGPNVYYGELIEKPYIGENMKEFNDNDISIAATVNRRVEVVAIFLVVLVEIGFHFLKI